MLPGDDSYKAALMTTSKQKNQSVSDRKFSISADVRCKMEIEASSNWKTGIYVERTFQDYNTPFFLY